MEADGKPEQMETKDNDALSFCPSFNSYSSDRSAQIAAEVIDEIPRAATADDHLDDEDADFEFSFVRGDREGTEDEISCDGCEFGQIFPVFRRDIMFGGNRDREDGKANFSTIKLPLKKLFDEDRDDHRSSSSSEVDELDRIPEGTYCVWRPKAVEDSPNRCKKSSSTGSASKRWNFRDLLLRRSNSEGKEAFVFLTPQNKEMKAGRIEGVENSRHRQNSEGNLRSKGDAGGRDKAALSIENSKQNRNSDGNSRAKGLSGGRDKAQSAHEVFYVRNRASMAVDKKKSYLPYRQDLVGFFASVNGVRAGKTFPPF